MKAQSREDECFSKEVMEQIQPFMFVVVVSLVCNRLRETESHIFFKILSQWINLKTLTADAARLDPDVLKIDGKIGVSGSRKMMI